MAHLSPPASEAQEVPQDKVEPKVEAAEAEKMKESHSEDPVVNVTEIRDAPGEPPEAVIEGKAV